MIAKVVVQNGLHHTIEAMGFELIVTGINVNRILLVPFLSLNAFSLKGSSGRSRSCFTTDLALTLILPSSGYRCALKGRIATVTSSTV